MTMHNNPVEYVDLSRYNARKKKTGNKNNNAHNKDPQVSKFNGQGMNTHAVIVENGLTRRQALALEQKITDKHAARNNGKMPSIYHQRPKPSVNTIEGYIKLYKEPINRSTGERY